MRASIPSKQALNVRSLLVPFGVFCLGVMAAFMTLRLSAVDDFRWQIKAIALGTVGPVLFFGLLLRYERAKRFIPYVLAILISETGFAYEFTRGYQTSANEVLTVMILLVWFTRRIFGGRSLAPSSYFSRQLKIFCGVAAAGVVTAFFFGVRPLNIITEFKSYVLYLFYLFLIPECITSERELRRIVLFMMILSLVPLYYGVTGSMALTDIVEERLSVSRWGALNIFVGYILPIFFLAFGSLLDEKRKWPRVLLVSYLGAILYVLLLAQTRTAWVAMAIGFGMFLLLSKRKIAALAVTFLIVMGVMLSPVGERAEDIVRHRIVAQTLDPDHSLKDRYLRWEGAWATAKAYPMTGSGWGGVLALTAEGSIEAVLPYLPLWHDSYLEILSQLGFPGLLAFLLLWWTMMKTEGKRLFLSGGPKKSMLSGGMFIAVAVCLIYALAEQQFYRLETASHSYFLAGLLLASGKIMIANPKEASVPGQARSDQTYKAKGI